MHVNSYMRPVPSKSDTRRKRAPDVSGAPSFLMNFWLFLNKRLILYNCIKNLVNELLHGRLHRRALPYVVL